MKGPELPGGPDGPGPISSLPVEDLPELSWQRIERRLFSALEGRGAERERGGEVRLTGAPAAGVGRPRVRAWVAGGAVAAAALIVLWPGRGGEEGRSGGRSPSRIATAEAASAVSVGDVSLEVAPHSALLVDEDEERGVLVVLERGGVTCRVPPRKGEAPVVVQAGEVRVEVTGTVFSVTRAGEAAHVVVVEGTVQLTHRGRQHVVVAPGAWPVTEAGTGTEAETESETETETEAETETETGTGTGTGTEIETGTEMEMEPEAMDLPARRGATRRPARVRASDKERYEAAAGLEASDPEAALVIYRELARAGGAWAANARYARARLELELGREARARRLLEEYLRRHPRGPNAADARALLERLP